jgi:hypothetical protein
MENCLWEPPDVLNSKIKKIRIELPHYSFSHSSSGDSPHAFIGRERSHEKLKKVIEDSPDEPGVYLIAGNRGVGKTSLVSEIIKETSLQTKSKFTENLRYLLLLLLAVIVTQFCSQVFRNSEMYRIISGVVSFLIFALSFILLCCFNDYRRKIPEQASIWKRIKNYGKSAFIELSYFLNPDNPQRNTQYMLKIVVIVSFIQIVSIISYITPVIAFLIYSGVVFVYNIIFRFGENKSHEYKQKNKKGKLSKNSAPFLLKLKNLFLTPILVHIKNCNRLYLRINFGHKLNDEKDILRLIAHTLNTEYHRHHHLFRRMLLRRVMTFGLLILFTCLFSSIVEKQEFYNSLIKEKELYKASSQAFLNNSIKDKYALITFDKMDKIRLKQAFSQKGIFSKGQTFLLVLDQLVFEITKIVKRAPQYFWTGKVDFCKFVYPINYLSCLLFFLMYLLIILILHCNWITHFFVSHQLIKRRLRKLNSDITHRTERENSIHTKSESNVPGIGMKTKKSRGIADAREIEKELQDILNDIQQIPAIMCRPKVVIVFDELDKVEPGDTGSEKENQQTKASLFSIDAARERQTEILRILSNMKYFFSTARAKFIFIAGREMLDIHLADVSERNNYIGSIFNVVIPVPSFLTDHPTGKKNLRQESGITLLPEEFVCRRLIPYDYQPEAYDLKSYRVYLENEIYKQKKGQEDDFRQEKIEKIIAVLQQFIIYLAHVSKGAPKKMVQIFESFVEIHIESDTKNKNTLFVQRYHNSRHFLSFNYYKQYTLGVIAYLITPILYRLSESNIKEYSDKLLVSTLRFIDFLFKFHKFSFSWKHLEISPEMLEINRAPELKSVAVELLNYLAQVHINKSNFSLYDYKFDSWIANEIFTMTKTDDVFSALFSFSLDELLPLKKHYIDLLEKTQKEYYDDKTNVKYNKGKYIDSISSLQIVLGDLCYYNDELEEAGVYYKNAVELLREDEDKEIMDQERLYLYVRNKLKLGLIHEKRRQYDFAYLTYGELCKRIIKQRDTGIYLPSSQYLKNISSCKCDMSFEKMTYEGLKMLYLPFIAKLQILEKSHVGGITRNHLIQLDEEFEILTNNINHEEAALLEAEFYSRVADILYYKNSDLKRKKKDKETTNSSCTACYYYHKALSTLLGKHNYDKIEKKDKNTVKRLLIESVAQLKENRNMKYCTILARIPPDWGNVFFSCDIHIREKSYNSEENKCYICDATDCNTQERDISETILKIYINCVASESKEWNRDAFLKRVKTGKCFTKMEIAFAMYSISSAAYCKINLYKRSSYQIYKMLCLFRHYKIYENEKSKDCIEQLSKKAIHYLWYANDDLNVLELNKRKKDFGKEQIDKSIPLQSLLVDSEITKIRILVKKMELKLTKEPKDLKRYYDLRITSPYKVNYSIGGRIALLRLKSKVNYETYKLLLKEAGIQKIETDFILKANECEKLLKGGNCNENIKEIFGKYFEINGDKVTNIEVFENLIAETIYCLTDIAQLSETMDETYVFTHSFFGSIHKYLSFWIRQYEAYEMYLEKNPKIAKQSRIDEYLEQYLDEEWREQLSGYRENQRALLHYSKCLEMHSEGRAYHNMIDTMYYVKDDYNDRSDHFNIAEERHIIVNKKIEKEINEIKDIYKDSKLYDTDRYFNK